MDSIGNSNFSNVDTSIEKCLVSFVIRSDPTSSYIKNSIAVCVLNVILTIAGTILNGMVLFIFWNSASMRTRISNFTILILTTIDFLVVITVHPLFVFQRVNELLEKSKCQYVEAYFFTAGLLSGVSAWTLFVINWERYLAIVYPFWHHVKVTKKRFVLTCVLFWFIYCSNLISALFFYSHHANIVFCFSLAVMCFTSIFIYLKIFWLARKRMCTIPPQQNSSVYNTDTTTIRRAHHSNMSIKTDTSIKQHQDSDLHITTDTTEKPREENNLSETEADTSSRNVRQGDSDLQKTDTTKKLHEENTMSEADTCSRKVRQDSNVHKTDTTKKFHKQNTVSKRRTASTTQKIKVFLNELKTAKVYVIIVLVSFFSYLPAGVVFAIQNPESKVAISKERNSIAKAYPWLLTCCSISSTLNSLVFFWGNKKLKREAHKIYARYFK